MWKPTTNAQTLPLAQQIAILVFSGFYFIHWFIEPMTMTKWLMQISAFAVFLMAYFIGFNIPKLTLPCAICMVILSFLVAPYNYGANTFAIYACSFFAYYQPPKRALFFIAMTLLSLLVTTLMHQLHLIFFFGVSAVMIFGLSFSGMIDRQRLQHQQREQHSQNEIMRLAKVAERERISQDLHDVIGHSLTGIYLKAQLTLKRLEQGDQQAAKEQCIAVAQLAQSALKEIRATLADMKKQSLADELDAQQTFLASLEIEFQYHLPKEQLTTPAIESDLLLIVRELITNTLRHAQASKVRVTLTINNNAVQLNYSDNGNGMKSHDESDFGNGLQGIRQRVHQRGGAFDIHNNAGLHINLTLPRSLSYEPIPG